MRGLISCTKTGDEWASWRRAQWFEIPSVVHLIHFVRNWIWHHLHYPCAKLWIDRRSGVLQVIGIKHEGSRWLINLCRNEIERR